MTVTSLLIETTASRREENSFFGECFVTTSIVHSPSPLPPKLHWYQ